MLCIKCHDLCGLVDPHQDKDFLHHETFVELHQSADSGCRLCQIIHRGFEEKREKATSESCAVMIKSRRNTGMEVSFVATNPRAGGDPQAKGDSLVIAVIFESLELPPRLQLAAQFHETSHDTNTGSDVACQLASTWLHECLENHQLCRQAASNEHPPLPSRVIDVGPCGASAEPYLLETSGLTGKYLTLSHCWGGGQPIRTTTANIQSHRLQVKVSDLPRIFREAVQVTRMLGFRYIWIDSLCIIQDDTKDWEAEAALMHQYYKLSLLTIAAADASSSEDGLFRDRDRLRNQPCELVIRGLNGSLQTVYAFTNSMSSELKRSGLSDSFKPFPLYSRAWVLQEQVLSPRILTYARDRIFWRCQEALFDERAPLAKRIEGFISGDKISNIVRMAGDPRSTDATVAELQQNWIFPAGSAPARARLSRNIGYHKEGCFLPEDRFLIDWGDIVQEYTERSMTFQTDKLIAIKGIANAAAPIVSRDYFAGLWIDSHRSITMGLLWSSGRKKIGHQRLDIAPSWSWASTPGEVSWPGHWLCQLECRIRILELKKFETATRASAELVVETHLRAGRKVGDNAFAIVDWPPTQAADASSPRTWPVDRLTTPVILDESLENTSSVWFAEVAAGKVHVQGDRKDLHCLVLVELGNEPTYRRVGYSIWQESIWMNMELPETKKMRLKVV